MKMYTRPLNDVWRTDDGGLILLKNVPDCQLVDTINSISCQLKDLRYRRRQLRCERVRRFFKRIKIWFLEN